MNKDNDVNTVRHEHPHTCTSQGAGVLWFVRQKAELLQNGGRKKKGGQFNPDETRTRNIDLRRVAAYPLAYRAGSGRICQNFVVLNSRQRNEVDNQFPPPVCVWEAVTVRTCLQFLYARIWLSFFAAFKAKS